MTAREALIASAEEIQRRIEDHQALLIRAITGKGDDGNARIEAGLLVDCPHKRRLKATLTEAIHVLEETRSAFKSKRLEALRKKLILVLSADE